MTNFNPQIEKIGDILINEGFINKDQLAEVLEEQKIKKDKIGRILINKGYIKEDVLVNAYSLQSGYKSNNEDEILECDLDAVSLISEEFAKEKRIIGRTKKRKNNYFYDWLYHR